MTDHTCVYSTVCTALFRSRVFEVAGDRVSLATVCTYEGPYMCQTLVF